MGGKPGREQRIRAQDRAWRDRGSGHQGERPANAPAHRCVRGVERRRRRSCGSDGDHWSSGAHGVDGGHGCGWSDRSNRNDRRRRSDGCEGPHWPPRSRRSRSDRRNGDDGLHGADGGHGHDRGDGSRRCHGCHRHSGTERRDWCGRGDRRAGTDGPDRCHGYPRTQRGHRHRRGDGTNRADGSAGREWWDRADRTNGAAGDPRIDRDHGPLGRHRGDGQSGTHRRHRCNRARRNIHRRRLVLLLIEHGDHRPSGEDAPLTSTGDANTSGAFSLASNTVTVNQAGTYSVWFSVALGPGAASAYQLVVGGTLVPGSVGISDDNGSTQHQGIGFAVVNVPAGAAVAVRNVGNSASTLANSVDGATPTSVMLTLLKLS